MQACNDLNVTVATEISCYPPDLQQLFRSAMAAAPENRGSLNSIVENAWFQDPLIKTYRYLEGLKDKDEVNKVQFLKGLVKILDKFDRRSLIRKVLPLMLREMQHEKLCLLVLPIVLRLLNQEGFIEKDDF